MIYFNVIKRKNPKDGTVKYYAQAYGRRVISQKELMDDVEKQTSLTSGDVKNAIDSLLYVIKKNLSDGRSVKLDGIGTFSVSIKSRGVSNKKDFTTADVKRKMINFRASTDLREYINQSSVADWSSTFGKGSTSGSSEVKPNV